MIDVLVISLVGSAAVLLLGLLAIRAVREVISNRRTREVVQKYAPEFQVTKPDEEVQEKPKKTKTRTSVSAQVTKRLEEGELNLSPKQWLGVQIAIFLLVSLLLLVFTRNIALSSLIGVAIALFAPSQFLKMRLKKRLESFEAELPDVLMLVASALRSGLSFQQALEATVSDRETELGNQMRLAINESKLGPPLEECLSRVADRMRSEDLRWLVAALEIQREVGGTLSTILDTAASTIKGREELRREVRSLSAEGRLSAYVLIGLPIMIFAVLLFTRPSYVEIFWTELIGIVMLVIILALVGVGWLWMNKMVKIKV